MNPVELAFRAVCRDCRSRLAASLTALSSGITTVLVVLLPRLPHTVGERSERSAWQRDPLPAAPGVRSAGVDLARGQRLDRLDVGLLPLIGIVVLVALSVALLALVARRTGATRQHRLVALRASGATPRQQVAPVIVEVLSASAVGTLGGILIVWPLRSLAMRMPRAGGAWFVSDVAPSLAVIAAAGVGVPLLAVCAALAGIRAEAGRLGRGAGGEEVSAARRPGRGPRVLPRARGPRTW